MCVCVYIYMCGDDLESAGEEKREVVVHEPAPSGQYLTTFKHLITFNKSAVDHFLKVMKC